MSAAELTHLVYGLDGSESQAILGRVLVAPHNLLFRGFASTASLLECECWGHPCCLVLDDVGPNGTRGWDVIQRLAGPASQIPIVILSAPADVHSAVQYMRAGAFDVLEKSVSPSKLFDAIVAATQIDHLRESHRRRLIELLEAFRSLTARQRVILKHLLDGKVNKWIYTELEISRRTLDLDRAAIMTRFQTSNFLVVARNVLELELQFESLGKELPWETDEMSTPAKLPSMSADYPPADKSTTAELA